MYSRVSGSESLYIQSEHFMNVFIKEVSFLQLSKYLVLLSAKYFEYFWNCDLTRSIFNCIVNNKEYSALLSNIILIILL